MCHGHKTSPRLRLAFWLVGCHKTSWFFVRSGWSFCFWVPGFHGARGFGTVFGRCQEWVEKSEISERIPTWNREGFFWHTPVTGSLWQLRGWHHFLSEGWRNPVALMWKNITSSWMDKNSLVGTSKKLPNSCISERLLDVFLMLDLTYWYLANQSSFSNRNTSTLHRKLRGTGSFCYESEIYKSYFRLHELHQSQHFSILIKVYLFMLI